MDNSTKKLVAQALLEAATALSGSTEKRLKFVWPKLSNEFKLAILEIVFNAIGLDRWKTEFKPDDPDYQVKAADSDAILEHFSDKLRDNDLVDAYIPWLATRISKERNPQAYLVVQSISRFRSICLWAKETKTDLNKLGLLEAMEQARDYVPNAARKSKEDSDANPVVYRFADGHKVVELRTDEALKREGDVMKHCVGSYCDAVKAGDSTIYSLRTKDGESLITMEYASEAFQQMFGEGNTDPTDEVKPYLIEFVENKYPDDVMALVMAGKPPKDIKNLSKLSKTELQQIIFRGIDLTNVDLSGSILPDCDFKEADMTGANLSNCNLFRAHLEGVTLRGANLQNATLIEAMMDEARLKGANLAGAVLQDAMAMSTSFLAADLTGANLKGLAAVDSDFRKANLSNALLTGSFISGANFTDANLTGAILTGATYSKTSKHNRQGTLWPAGFVVEDHSMVLDPDWD